MVTNPFGATSGISHAELDHLTILRPPIRIPLVDDQDGAHDPGGNGLAKAVGQRLTSRLCGAPIVRPVPLGKIRTGPAGEPAGDRSEGGAVKWKCHVCGCGASEIAGALRKWDWTGSWLNSRNGRTPSTTPAGWRWQAKNSIVEGEDFQGRVSLRQVFSTDASGVIHVQSMSY